MHERDGLRFLKIKAYKIIEENIHNFHSIQKNIDNLEKVVNQDIWLIDEVFSWMNNLEVLKVIKGKKYQMLLSIQLGYVLDNIDDWVENIHARNRVMLALNEDIQKMQARVQTQILKVDNYYNEKSLEILSNDSKDQLITMEIVFL